MTLGRLALAQRTISRRYARIAEPVAEHRSAPSVSVASLREIAIKRRLGKLDLGTTPWEFIAYLGTYGASVLSVGARHAVAEILPEPPTRDPFGRMLLAQCQVEGLSLVTVDRALVDHPPARRGQALSRAQRPSRPGA